MASDKFMKDVSTAKKRDYAQILGFAQVAPFARSVYGV